MLSATGLRETPVVVETNICILPHVTFHVNLSSMSLCSNRRQIICFSHIIIATQFISTLHLFRQRMSLFRNLTQRQYFLLNAFEVLKAQMISFSGFWVRFRQVFC